MAVGDKDRLRVGAEDGVDLELGQRRAGQLAARGREIGAIIDGLGRLRLDQGALAELAGLPGEGGRVDSPQTAEGAVGLRTAEEQAVAGGGRGVEQHAVGRPLEAALLRFRQGDEVVFLAGGRFWLLDEEALEEAAGAQGVDPSLVAGDGEGHGGARGEAWEALAFDAHVATGPGDGAVTGGEDAATGAGEAERDDALGLDIGGAGGLELELHVAGRALGVDDPGVVRAVGPHGAAFEGDQPEDGVLGDLAAMDGGLLLDVPQDLAVMADAAPQAGSKQAHAVDEVGELGADLGDAGGEDAAVVEVMTTDPQAAVLGGLVDGGDRRAELDGPLDLEGGDAEQPQLVRQDDHEVLAVAAEGEREGAVVERGGVGGLGAGDGPLTRGARGTLDGSLPPHGPRAYHGVRRSGSGGAGPRGPAGRAQISSMRRSGDSMHSLMWTRNWTASRPSTRRWS